MYYTQEKTTSPRRLTVLLLVVTALFALFSTILATEALAASSSEYKVKQRTEDGTYYYYVYKGSLPKNYDATFYTNPKDVYKSSNGMKITFYQALGGATEEQADAFIRYLGSQTKVYWYCGYYGFKVKIGGESFTYWYVYKIEGWNAKGNVANLVTASPFKNSDKEKLYVEYIDEGDVVSDQWSYIRNNRECSAGIHLNIPNPKNGVTVGFRFKNKLGTAYEYCIFPFP